MFLSWEEPQGETKVESQPGRPESRAFAPAPSVGEILCPPVACPVSPCVSWHSTSLRKELHPVSCVSLLTVLRPAPSPETSL